MWEQDQKRPAYEKLVVLSKTMPMVLDTRVHRYLAVAKATRMGSFSSLEMACREVDQRATVYRGTIWVETPMAHTESYVIDLVRDRIYERAARQVETGCDPVLS